MIENMSRTTQELLVAIRFTLFPISFISGFWLLFALFYAEIITTKNKLIVGLIFAPLLTTYLPTITKDYFFLTVRHKVIENVAITDWGTFISLNFFISYLYIFLSIVIIFIKSIKDYKTLKKKVVLVLLAPIISLSICILSRLNILVHPSFDLTPISFSVFFLLISIAIFKYRFIDIIPYATMDIFHNIEEAMFILDTNNNIVNFNKAAEIEFKNLIFVDKVNDLFNELKKRSNEVSHLHEIIKIICERKVRIYHSQFEIMDDNDPHSKKRYDFYLKTIFNNNREEIGRIISFKNNTEASQILVDNERSRISEDIHDNLSNMINVVSMNLEYALKHHNKQDDALGCINTAYETAKGIRIKLRRILEELAPLDIEKIGLLNALESLFNKMVGTGIQIDFIHTGIEDRVIGKKNYAYVIYKTCMEAINNAFFNGKAQKISIILSCQDNLIKFLISDDGIGCETINKGRGLTGMEKRIHSLGGTVAFESVSNEGFNISVEIPL